MTAPMIGEGLAGSRSRQTLACLVGAVVVAGDLVTIHARLGYGYGALIAALAVVALLTLVRGDRASLGLTVAPQQGWGYWCRLTAVLVPIFLGAGALRDGLRWALTGDVPVPLPPELWWEKLASECLMAPPIEEVIYRLALCVPLTAILPRGAVIVASGLVFGLAHVLAGVGEATHFVMGFFFAWAYLKSGSIVVPVAFHALNNLWMLGVQIGAWYWFNG